MKTTIEMHAITPEAREILEKAWEEYTKEFGDDPPNVYPYRVLYWFIRYSSAFHDHEGKPSETVTVATVRSQP